MAEEKTPKRVPELLKKFRSQVHGKKIDAKEIEKSIIEGLKSARSEVRALAAKYGLSRFDHAWVKKNVLTLLEHEKSKKVLRVIEKYYDGKRLKGALDRLGLKTLKGAPKSSTKKAASTAPAPEGGAPPAEAAAEPAKE